MGQITKSNLDKNIFVIFSYYSKQYSAILTFFTDSYLTILYIGTGSCDWMW